MPRFISSFLLACLVVLLAPRIRAFSILAAPSYSGQHTISSCPQRRRVNGNGNGNGNGNVDLMVLQNAKSKNDNDGSNDDMNPLTKSSWYVVEWFGKAFGKKDDDSKEGVMSLNLDTPPASLQETLQRIKLDNDRSYFLSGQVDEEIYDPDCVFSDPFVSFEGRDRFVTNLANLGSFITKYDARVLDYTQVDDTTIQTRLMVKLELNLPWKPVLAWPWGVTYTVDSESCLIVDHKESWDIGAWDGVKQIFRKPTVRL